jgi:hypothetical protein
MQRRWRLNQTRPELIVATGRSEIARCGLDQPGAPIASASGFTGFNALDVEGNLILS